jgi:hypothetical protein
MKYAMTIFKLKAFLKNLFHLIQRQALGALVFIIWHGFFNHGKLLMSAVKAFQIVWKKDLRNREKQNP